MDQNNEGWQHQQEHYIFRKPAADLPLPFWIIGIVGCLYMLASFAEWFGL